MNLKRNVAQWSRWLHIYVSMISFIIVLFFSATGLTLNHADFFTGEPKVKNVTGNIDKAWVEGTDTNTIKKLEIVEFLRKVHHITAGLSEFRIEESQCSISFKGPGYGADAFVERATGAYEINIMQAGTIAILNDLHKGRDSGSTWSWIIDISAILMVVISLTGLILLLYIKRKRLPGIILLIIGLLLSIMVYAIWV